LINNTNTNPINMNHTPSANSILTKIEFLIEKIYANVSWYSEKLQPRKHPELHNKTRSKISSIFERTK